MSPCCGSCWRTSRHLPKTSNVSNLVAPGMLSSQFAISCVQPEVTAAFEQIGLVRHDVSEAIAVVTPASNRAKNPDNSTTQLPVVGWVASLISPGIEPLDKPSSIERHQYRLAELEEVIRGNSQLTS